MKYRLLLVACALVLGSAFLVPEVTHAQGFVPCTGDVGDECQFCNLVELIDNVIDWLVVVFGTIAAIIIVVAGAALVTSGGNVSAKMWARKLIYKMIVGFVLVLAGWLLIDFVVKILVSEDGKLPEFGPWHEIECVKQPRAVPYIYNRADLEEEFGEVDGSTAADPYAAGDCSPDNLKGFGMTQTQANTFSCIARAESGCNLNADNPNSTARGVFQIVRGWNDRCHNLNLPECSAAVGVSGNLNCSQYFSGGHVKPGFEAEAAVCDQAASNMECNTAAALCLYNNGGYGHWTGTASDPHEAQIACVAQYAE